MSQRHVRWQITLYLWFTNGARSAPSEAAGTREQRSGKDQRLMRRTTMTTTPSALITGASSGIGAKYADRFARRGHDLVLVARNRVRMEQLADRLRRETGVTVDILQADLADPGGLAKVEARLRDDHRIGILVNNAGTAPAGGFVDQSPDEVARI